MNGLKKPPLRNSPPTAERNDLISKKSLCIRPGFQCARCIAKIFVFRFILLMLCTHRKCPSNSDPCSHYGLEIEGKEALSYFDAHSLLSSAELVGSNGSFARLFGFKDGCVHISMFRALQGPQTDKKKLQAAWSQVLNGVEKVIVCKLYHATGICITVKSRMSLKIKQNIADSRIVAMLMTQVACSDQYKIPIRRQKHMILQGIHPRTIPSESGQDPIHRLLQKLESLVSEQNMQELKAIIDCLGPKDMLDRALSDGRAPTTVDSNTLLGQPAVDCPALIARKNRATIVSSIDMPRQREDEDPPRLLHTAKQREMSQRDQPSCVVGVGRNCPSSVHEPEADPFQAAARARRATAALRSTLPATVAEAILDGRAVDPVTLPCVSVLFCDVVDFTALSAALPAAMVACLLRRLFGRFDALAQRHGVQRVDVIGDCYVAATNFLEKQVRKLGLELFSRFYRLTNRN